MDKQNLRKWSALVDECENRRPSGVTRAQWFGEKGVHDSLYYYWRNEETQNGAPKPSDADSEVPCVKKGFDASVDFGDITDIVNGSNKNTEQKQTPADSSSRAAHASLAGLLPEAMIQAEGSTIYLLSSIQKKTHQKILEVLHVC